MSQNTLSHLIFCSSVVPLLSFFSLVSLHYFVIFFWFNCLLFRCGKQFQFKLPALLTFFHTLGTLISVNKSPKGRDPAKETRLKQNQRKQVDGKDRCDAYWGATKRSPRRNIEEDFQWWCDFCGILCNSCLRYFYLKTLDRFQMA